MSRRFKDPITGDTLTLGERISWFAQGIIRRWAFLGAITVITAVVWIVGSEHVLVWWNLAASYMALLIEGTVGIAMFSQTRRDALVLREVRKVTKHCEALIEHHGVGQDNGDLGVTTSDDGGQW